MGEMTMVQGLDHIGIAVASIERASVFYQERLGFRYTGEEVLGSQGVRVAFMEKGPIRIELLEPMGEQGPIAKFLAKRGPGLHHLAFACCDVAGQLKTWDEAGMNLIHKHPATGAHGNQVAFLDPGEAEGVLVEVCCPASNETGTIETGVTSRPSADEA